VKKYEQDGFGTYNVGWVSPLQNEGIMVSVTPFWEVEYHIDNIEVCKASINRPILMDSTCLL
jgi:hypothetical protein